MKAKNIALGIVLSAAAGLALHASSIGSGGSGATAGSGGTTMGRPVAMKLPNDATQWNEFGVLYAIRDYENLGIKPVKVEVIDLGPSWTPLSNDLTPYTGYVDVSGTIYPLVKDMTTGKLSTTLPASAFGGGVSSLLVTAFDRNGVQLGCFTFGSFF